MLTLLTTTGARPEAWRLCEAYMLRQEYAGAVLWIVVDDGPEPSRMGKLKKNWTREIVRPDPLWRPGLNTQGRNLYVGLRVAQQLAEAGGSPLRLAIIEDDDWYAADWLRIVDRHLDRTELVGEAPARFYNVRWRHWDELSNFRHACLRASAMRGAAIEQFRETLRTPHKTYDFMLWHAFGHGRTFEGVSTVGIKAMPGRPGIASGHDAESGKRDNDWEVLRRWIGNDWRNYEKFYARKADMSGRKMIALQKFEYDKRVLMPGDEFVLVKRSDGYLFNRFKKAKFADPEARVERVAPAPMPAPEPIHVPIEEVRQAVDLPVDNDNDGDDEDDDGA